MNSLAAGAAAEVFVTHSEADTLEVGRRLASRLTPGSVVLLTGELGSGKTVLVRGLAEGLGAAPDAVSSPTFVLIQEYAGRVPLRHVDLYRVERAEIDDLGLDELFDETAIVAIEWAEKLSRPPAGAVRVEIRDLGGETREITVRSGPAEPAPCYSDR